MTNQQSVAATPGTLYTANVEAAVYCTFLNGNFYTSFPTFQFEVATTKSETDSTNPLTDSQVLPDGTVDCALLAHCTAATSPPICNPSLTQQHPLIAGMLAKCHNYYESLWLAERPRPGFAWTCLPLVPGQNAVGTQDASLGACTH